MTNGIFVDMNHLRIQLFGPSSSARKRCDSTDRPYTSQDLTSLQRCVNRSDASDCGLIQANTHLCSNKASPRKSIESVGVTPRSA
jgi:hypothetical protein